jgi:hypothetical protein
MRLITLSALAGTILGLLSIAAQADGPAGAKINEPPKQTSLMRVYAADSVMARSPGHASRLPAAYVGPQRIDSAQVSEGRALSNSAAASNAITTGYARPDLAAGAEKSLSAARALQMHTVDTARIAPVQHLAAATALDGARKPHATRTADTARSAAAQHLAASASPFPEPARVAVPVSAQSRMAVKRK